MDRAVNRETFRDAAQVDLHRTAEEDLPVRQQHDMPPVTLPVQDLR
jgi:hypothetical protein